MAKVKGNLYVIKHKSAIGHKSKTLVHATDQKAAEKVAKELFPRSGSKFKVKRYEAKQGSIVRQDIKEAGGGTHESTESMAHHSDDEPFEEEVLTQTFTTPTQTEDETEEDD